MNYDEIADTSPEILADMLFELIGVRFDSKAAGELWPKILQHKWLLSEKLGRDVGLKIASIDFIDNMEQALSEYDAYNQMDALKELGAQKIGAEAWSIIADSQPPKQLVQRKIVVPLIEEDLSRKHGVVPPKTIIFFGPPGTGKTHFAKAIAGALAWWFIEISPSTLMVDGVDRMGANLRKIMERVRGLNEAVVFIDEFEELAANRDEGTRIDKSITNEFLKQVPLLKCNGNKVLLVCATNYIRQLDAALLRPGRFDCIIPVGGLNAEERKTILSHFLSQLNAPRVDLETLVRQTARFTPADIEYFFRQVAQYAFEEELARKRDYPVTNDTLLRILPTIKPSLTDEIVAEFEEDVRTYSRT